MAVENTGARIGKTLVVRGEVTGGEDLMIDGRVEGKVQLSGHRLTVGPSAQVQADLTAQDLLILGRVRGNITAEGRLEMRAGCVVEGDVRAMRLAIEDNAVFRGKVELSPNANKAREGGRPPVTEDVLSERG